MKSDSMPDLAKNIVLKSDFHSDGFAAISVEDYSLQ
jgi:hypothetical protein